MVVGKDAAQTPSRFSVRSSTPDATTYPKINPVHIHTNSQTRMDHNVQ